ncbi:phosphate ABC transporter permease subunit PstC [Thauera sinica]|uniref:Phosphate transport system permease protein n=1 Tax=Thauera sinica TaxID=2665146 RepID=A0ABW1AVV0_9RHOO|nr:phosphate ABC transporter permease subunit PstC [Thauera sp. K11]ATE60296.1 phosphate ABC transporter permease subunit PstC [Thauera sp. K11]
MNNLTVAAALLILAGFAYQVGLMRSRQVATGTVERMHSRPSYHGLLAVLRAAFPALGVYLLWRIFGQHAIESLVLGAIPAENVPADPLQQRALLQRIGNLASGFGLLGEAKPFEQAAAAHMRRLAVTGQAFVAALMATVAAFGVFWSWRHTTVQTRARNKVEKALQIGLIACSAVAIFTTVGIVLSMLGEAFRFFHLVNPLDFFFGTTWNPRFVHVGTEGQTGFGMLPLMAGTLLISVIAMLVAVPLGLMTAIYLSEYAAHQVRAVAKPVIEVLAGIPTIVYGFFALVTVGPFLSALGASVGLTIRATSALTAGLVMGIMIIPFISSLSDDIITQVPKAMRDGSLALGGTRSETVIRVVLPAALPGIVGAFLLAVSRAIGETMIVVLAAGNAPVLTANPFEAVSTVTVSIVNQLTGDADFASPQSLVAFALGLTLFAMTLVLNVIALVVVRKYREQYE